MISIALIFFNFAFVDLSRIITKTLFDFAHGCKCLGITSAGEIVMLRCPYVGFFFFRISIQLFMLSDQSPRLIITRGIPGLLATGQGASFLNV